MQLHLPIIALSVIASLYAVYYFTFGAPWQAQPILLIETGKLIIGWLALYSVGFLIRPDSVTERAVLICFGLMTAIAIWWANWRDLSFILEYMPTAPKGVSSYSGIATVYLVVATSALAFAKSRASQVGILAVSIFTMFLLSSRSEIAADLILCGVWAFITLLNRNYLTAVVGVVLVGAIFSSMLYYPSISKKLDLPVLESVENSPRAKIAELNRQQPVGNFRNSELPNITESQSFLTRKITLESGISDIERSPFVGAYGSQIKRFGQFGLYIHNALSAWQQYGLLSFILYVGASIASVAGALWAVIVQGSREKLWLWAAYVSSLCLILIIATKAVYWPDPAFGWGLVASAWSSRYYPLAP